MALWVSAKAGLAELASQWSSVLRAKLGSPSHPPTRKNSQRGWKFPRWRWGQDWSRKIEWGKRQGPGLGRRDEGKGEKGKTNMV